MVAGSKWHCCGSLGMPSLTPSSLSQADSTAAAMVLIFAGGM
jgi:hypothetical protein